MDNSLVMSEDEIKRRIEEYKRKLLKGEKNGVDWRNIFDGFLQNGNFRDGMQSNMSNKELEEKFASVLFNPMEACVNGIFIPCGWNDESLYKVSFHRFEMIIYSLYIINRAYDVFLPLSSSKNNKESANAFQKILVDFFYDTISIEYADCNFDSMQNDWIVNIYSVDVGGYEIRYTDYCYKTSLGFIKKIETLLKEPPKTFIGKKVFTRKVNKLVEMYFSWKEKNEIIMTENLKSNFRQLT